MIFDSYHNSKFDKDQRRLRFNELDALSYALLRYYYSYNIII